MFQTLRNAWKIADLRKKLLYTLMIIAIFRIGAAIPVPFLNPEAISAMIHTSGNLLGYQMCIRDSLWAVPVLLPPGVNPHWATRPERNITAPTSTLSNAATTSKAC